MNYPLGAHLGIIGGGQLARMLALACHEMGLVPVVLSASPNDPAAQVVQKWIQGTANDAAALRKLLEISEQVTFESEFSDIKTEGDFSFVEQHLQKFFPRLPLMSSLQDRRTQKQLLDKYKIPQPRYAIATSVEEFQSLLQEWKPPFVLKKARGGYDGFGTFIFKTNSEVKKFLNTNQWPGPCTLEEFIPFQREVATLFARSRSGDQITYPLVQSHQKDHRCDWVQGPEKSKYFLSMSKRFQALLKAENYVGLLAVEMFETRSGLLVNELAPRVHNSGHYTQNAVSDSQFHCHVKAGLGLDLNPVQLKAPAFVMTNLVGHSEGEFKIPDGVSGHLHWYGKTENRKGRKMGHINYTGSSAKSLLQKALKEREKIRK